MKVIDEIQEQYYRNKEAVITMPFELSKIKSAIMRDDIEYIRGVDVYSEEFIAHLGELFELADLSDASEIKLYFNRLIR